MRTVLVALVTSLVVSVGIGGTIEVPADYPTIQEAVDAAAIGDSVQVSSGTYYESVVIGKSISLLAVQEMRAIVRGDDWSAVKIDADWVTVRGFDLKGSTIALWMTSVSNCDVSRNILHDCGTGLIVGVFYEDFDKDSAEPPLSSRGARGAAAGDPYTECNAISENIIRGNGTGIWLFGMSLFIRNNTISGNVITNNMLGINADYSESTQITDNMIAGNSRGIEISQSLGMEPHVVYHNDFVNSLRNALEIDASASIWDDGYPPGGNYWSDYTGTDGDSDGIGDTPYDIPGGTSQDHYPLMSRYNPVCGDADVSGQVDIDDVVYLIAYIFTGPGPGLICHMDADGSFGVDIDDVVYLIEYIFIQGPVPVIDCCNPPW
ncbi:MAG: right-handed parallel beta-helix repeat-containing protein [candidate division Zixibacteria bacterium]|nr:right-handed parallel beta-helix repeat-containing protein [candidate division Zixibacteria bacterium]MBU1471229.1 right-handed parallel beta-helix repeat-containing protein [candidate division Zixibacteria bacterium]MBU2624931.1 right-handed parallel beta-helix repeat-containing protein [candidate division Zixibacteria bacterium]